jgi:2-polyprenyl-3-methyl-5-hydroxy-6-metoxy-1,4-benzoquinol methylase
MADAKTADYGWTPVAPGSSSYINPAIVKLVRAAGARDVLDAGCGNGELAADLAQIGCNVLGIDGDPGGIEHARAKFPNIHFEVGMFGDPPSGFQATPDGRFDYVVSTEVVEHLYAPHELARFCFEALRPGGELAISTPYHGYLKNLALSVANAWDKHHTVHWHGGHIKFWSAATLGKLLTDAGFELTGFVGVGRMPYLWKSMILTARKPS